MGKTTRKDKNGRTFKESLKKRHSRYKCRCEYCSGVSLNRMKEKIAEKELKINLENRE
jgi:hypothetical protein